MKMHFDDGGDRTLILISASTSKGKTKKVFTRRLLNRGERERGRLLMGAAVLVC